MCGPCPEGGPIFTLATLGFGLSLLAASEWQNLESSWAEGDHTVTLWGWKQNVSSFDWDRLGVPGGSRCFPADLLADPLTLDASQVFQVERNGFPP